MIISMDRVKFLDLVPVGNVAQRLNEAYDRVFNSGTYVGGKEVLAFEREWAEYCGAKYCVGVGNGFDALVLACSYMAEEFKPIKPAISIPWKTCLPTWAAARTSCTPFPMSFSPTLAIAVHIYGQITLPYKYNKDNLIEDCAQAHGAMKNGTKAGKFGKIACWSFYPTKNLGALGDAGAITTDDESVYEYAMDLRNYGTRDDMGINTRLDPLQAAFLRVKLLFLDHMNICRRENAASYRHNIMQSPKVILPFERGLGDFPCYHIFAIETDDRDSLMEHLESNGIQTMIHYSGVPYPSGLYIPEAEEWTKRTLSLPVAPHITPHVCKKISEIINEWITND
jgi:dTDP-4-amino-4,6-dideoxygalactose transaminase